MHQVDWRTGTSSKLILAQGHSIGLLFSLEKDIINPSRTLNESVCAHFPHAVGQSESAARHIVLFLHPRCDKCVLVGSLNMFKMH